MSRIKYPEADMVSQQINQILDRSGLFEKEADSELEYMEDDYFVRCEPVREKRSVIGMKLMITVAAVAAIILLAVTVGNYTPVKKSAPQALNAVSEDTTTIKANSKFRDGNITVSITDSTETIEGTDTGINSLNIIYYCGTIKRQNAFIGYEGSEYEANLITFATETEKYANELYSRFYGETEINESVLESINVEDAGLDNEAVVTVSDQASYRVTGMEKSYMEYRCAQFSYDAKKRQTLRFENIFTSRDMGVAELWQKLTDQIKADNSELTEDEVRVYLEDSLVEGNWFISTDGISVVVNGYETEESDTQTSVKSKTFVIPTGDLSYLKSDYK